LTSYFRIPHIGSAARSLWKSIFAPARFYAGRPFA
jgi:hypothetical protein